MLLNDSGLVYICGYPNGVLYTYDPALAWAPDGTIAGNPSALGGSFYATTGMKYPYFLAMGTNGRLYCAGRRERDADGSGIGYYTPGTGLYAGTNVGLEYFMPRGMVLLESEGWIVFSGELNGEPGEPAEAQLVVYDLDLTEVTRWTVQAGLQNTGLLFPTAVSDVIVGLTNDNPCLLYRFNVTTGVVLDSVVLGAVLIDGSTIRPADGFDLGRDRLVS